MPQISADAAKTASPSPCKLGEMRTHRLACTARRPALSLGAAAIVAAGLLPSSGNASTQEDARVQVLRGQHEALAPQLASNPFQRPLHLASSQSADDVKGEVYAVVEHPFALVNTSLRNAEHWCDILMLHFNIKACRASGGASSRRVEVSAGRKQDDLISRPYRMQFHYQLVASSPNYLHVRLSADSGPLGTQHYRIEVEATPLDAQRSFLHMTYSYGLGATARLAMQGYLSTLGRDKVGFSVVGTQADGQPIHVGGVRGVIERNTMRYYLAIDAYLNSLSYPAGERLERRLQGWFSSCELYRRQLHEMERDEYLMMKRQQLQSQ
jgi:hypothetical protein